jgi:hypothetical protein
LKVNEFLRIGEKSPYGARENELKKAQLNNLPRLLPRRTLMADRNIFPTDHDNLFSANIAFIGSQEE